MALGHLRPIEKPQLLAVDPLAAQLCGVVTAGSGGFTKSQAITDRTYTDDFNSCPAINSTFAICLTW